MQGTHFEIHQLNDAGEPVALRGSYTVHPGQPVEVAQSLARDVAHDIAADEGVDLGIFERTFKRVATVVP